MVLAKVDEQAVVRLKNRRRNNKIHYLLQEFMSASDDVMEVRMYSGEYASSTSMQSAICRAIRREACECACVQVDGRVFLMKGVK